MNMGYPRHVILRNDLLGIQDQTMKIIKLLYNLDKKGFVLVKIKLILKVTEVILVITYKHLMWKYEFLPHMEAVFTLFIGCKNYVQEYNVLSNSSDNAEKL